MMKMLLLLCLVLLAAPTESLAAPERPHAPSVAFYYEENLPPELAIYDAVVVHPDRFTATDVGAHPFGARLFAYTTVGELDTTSSYSTKVPKDWIAGDNPKWGSRIVDQSNGRWAQFFLSEVITPLWQRGYRGFFLDTLDSYQLIASTPEQRAAQEIGLVELVNLIKRTYPDARLIFNRGFEILPQVHGHVFAIVAESLFQGWDNGAGKITTVSAEDRDWLLEELNTVRESYGLPIIVIDYADASDRDTMRELARRIGELGFIPWVTTPALDALGVGRHDIVPRRVLIVYDARESDSIMDAPAHRFLATPLNYLGLVPEYHDVAAGLPQTPLSGRYAGIAVWLAAGNDQYARTLVPWFARQIDAGVPLAILNHGGIGLQERGVRALGLTPAGRAGTKAPFKVAEKSAQAGFEIEPTLTTGVQPLVHAPANAEVWLRLKQGETETIDPVAITAWGGYALAPHAIVLLPNELGARWVIDPFEFFTRALKLKPMPVPDVTTENGHRLLVTHIDGDGFANRAEFPGSPYASQVLLNEVLRKYRIPTTVSVIQGEIAGNGVYPKLSPDLEPIARAIFALPHVEIASHTFSHPFTWRALEAGKTGDALNLKIPGYRFSAATEIDGSVRYIDEQLAPAGKKTRVLLWSGDCDPGAAVVGRTYALGLGNMNGGDTFLNDTRKTVTEVAPIGVPKGDYFQVYAPNQNENVYTNLWTGPFYGYERVIETFKLTESPRRLKPVGIYYHTYSASKPASLKALQKVYDWALSQDLLAIPASEYIRKAQEFNDVVITRDGEDWGVHGARHLKTLRMALELGYPNLKASNEVMGFSDTAAARYLHLSGAPEVRLSLQSGLPQAPGREVAWGQSAAAR